MDAAICIIDSAPNLEQWLLNSSFNFSKQLLKRHLDLKRVRGQGLSYQQEVILPLNLLNHRDVTPNYRGPTVETIFEDSTFLIVNKPSMIHSVAQLYQDGDSLSSWLRLNYPKIYQSYQNMGGPSILDCGALYRLDYETSGVFIFLKTPQAYQKMRDGFSQIVKQKIYLALVEGIPTWDKQDLKLGMKAAGVSGKKIISHLPPFSTDYQETMTYIEVLERFKSVNRSLIKVEIKTGHRHQIRVACQQIGFPLWADSLYGRKVEGQHFCLHAHNYQLFWEGKNWSFSSNPPAHWPI